LYKIVVGVDGSEGAAAAIAWCREMAPRLAADVIVVHALRPDAEVPSLEQVDAWCAPFRDEDLPIRRVIEDEDPAMLLQRVACEEQADLVVIGATRRGELAGLLLGSVVEGLAYHARRPVLIVPADDS